MEDGAAPGFVQRAVTTAADRLSVVEMGGASVASDDNRVTEAAVRGFWKAYRGYMGFSPRSSGVFSAGGVDGTGPVTCGAI
jgi:anthranilate 1,2-dioxygenase large subunit